MMISLCLDGRLTGDGGGRSLLGVAEDAAAPLVLVAQQGGEGVERGDSILAAIRDLDIT